MKKINVSTGARTELIDITGLIAEHLATTDGLITAYVPHTTAGITINEGADPAVRHDILEVMNSMVPWSFNYRHMEGNSPAHIKATLTGSSVTVIIENGKMQLGTWQKIFFCEFDGPRNRTVWLKTIPRP